MVKVRHRVIKVRLRDAVTFVAAVFKPKTILTLNPTEALCSAFKKSKE